MTDQAGSNGRRPLPFGLLLALSFAVYWGSYIVDQTLRWSNHTAGFSNGVVHFPLYVLTWSTVFLPWSLIIYGLNRWKGYFSPRSAWVLAPSLLWALLMITFLCVQPPTPRGRFQMRTGSALPNNVEILRHSFEGGGLADLQDVFYFRCPPETTKSLIERLDLSGGHISSAKSRTEMPFPELAQWKEVVSYSRDDVGRNRYYTLETNKDHTEALLTIYSL